MPCRRGWRERAGLRLAGYKIGATNAQVQARFGVDAPFSGRLFADYVDESPLRVPAGAVNFHAIEAEFDFVMGRPLPPRAAPYTRDEVRAAVASVHPAIEVPDSRYADWLSMRAEDLIADNAIGCLLCLGPAAEGGLDRDLAGQQVIVRIDGEVVSEGAGANVLGDPWNVMVWLANQLSARGETLEAGHVVTTGSAADVVQCKPGDTVTAEFGPIGTGARYVSRHEGRERTMSTSAARQAAEAAIPNEPEPTEAELRVQLAAAYRLVEHFGWNESIYGHLTARVPGPERHFLINPYGLRYGEVTGVEPGQDHARGRDRGPRATGR